MEINYELSRRQGLRERYPVFWCSLVVQSRHVGSTVGSVNYRSADEE